MDQATIVSYWKRDPQDESSGQPAVLLDMVAGARDSPEESEEDDSDDVTEAHTASSTGKILQRRQYSGFHRQHHGQPV